MKILERAVDRPLPTFLAAGLVVFFGLVSLFELPVKRTPDVEIPFTFVVVPYPGAAPADVESEISIELEERLNSLDRLRHQNSISAEGVSAHILEFEDRTDMKEALRDAQDRVDLAEAELPDDAEQPVVQELSFDELPIVLFTLRGGADLYRLRRLASDLKPVLEAVPGVRRVDVFGGLEREVKVYADPFRLAEYDLTLADLRAALGRQSRSLPAGELRAQSANRLIRPTGEFAGLEEIREITVSSEALGPIPLRAVARVELSHTRRTSAAWLDSEPSVTLLVKRRHDVNTVETVELLKARVQELRADLPPGVTIVASSDSSIVIGRMLRQLGTSAGIGLALVILVLFVMFGLRQALLVGSVLPFALLFTLIGLHVAGMEISNIAIFALILVLGLVVDGAIIVGEAIQTETEAGASPADAAKAAIARVGTPVIAADLTTVSAFLPMLLMVGVMGQFMSVMPKVVAFALIGSIFVDHLLLPAATARLGPARPQHESLLYRWLGFSPELRRARSAYRHWLERALRHRARVLAGAALALAFAALLFAGGAIPSIFLPRTDQGRFSVNYALPLGTPLAETNRVGLLIAEQLEGIPEIERYVLTTGDTGALAADGREGGRNGPEYGRITVELVEVRERDLGQSEIVAALRPRLERYAGVEIDVDEVSEGPDVGAALAVRVLGERQAELAAVADEVERRLEALPDATDVRTDYDMSRPEIRVALDRARAGSRYGISPDQVAETLLTVLHGIEVGRMWVDEERVDLRLEAPEASVATLDALRELPLRASDGSLIPLGEVARVELDYGENAIFRHDTRRAITVRADARDGASTVALSEAATEVLSDLSLPAGTEIEVGGESEERDRSYASLWRALSWAVLLIYCVMAVQFDSLRQPLIVLLTVPLAMVGVTAGLLVTGTPFSFMVFIGAVSLTGIVVNDGIVLVDAINRERARGVPLGEAIPAASESRLRPVILTTITTIAGLLPLTLNIAGGGEFWVPLGIAIISGLVVASGLTLFVVPSLYALIERERGLPPLRVAPAAIATGDERGPELPRASGD
jgi:HAE1 family hydrophobic/amphiphilic exporter-1